jgi:hypothetical protein
MAEPLGMEDKASIRNILSRTRRLTRAAYGIQPSEALSGDPENALWRTLVGDFHDGQWPAHESNYENFKAFEWSCTISEEEYDIAEKDTDRTTIEKFDRLHDFLFDMGRAIRSRRFCSTDKSRIGVVPPFSEIGDRICLVAGDQQPYVVRPTKRKISKGGPIFELVGPCYVHGIMDGKLASQVPWDRLQIQ